MTKECENCGSILPSGQRIDSRFCSDSCKDTYWNNVKRVTARKNKAIKAIQDIKALMNESNESIWALRAIKEELKDIEWQLVCGFAQNIGSVYWGDTV